MICPACGAEAHRSHSHGVGEKLFKLTSGYRVYRCRKCQWRGWVAQADQVNVVSRARTYFYFVVVLILTTLLALYYTSRIIEQGPVITPPQ